MTKTIFRASVAILLTALPCVSQELPSQASAVQEVLSSSIRALSSGDIEVAKKLCTSDYQLIEEGEIWNLERDLASSKEAFLSGTRRSDQLEFKKTQVTGNSAFVLYILTSQITRKGIAKQYQWIETAFFTKIEGCWRITLVHSTEIPFHKRPSA